MSSPTERTPRPLPEAPPSRSSSRRSIPRTHGAYSVPLQQLSSILLNMTFSDAEDDHQGTSRNTRWGPQAGYMLRCRTSRGECCMKKRPESCNFEGKTGMCGALQSKVEGWKKSVLCSVTGKRVFVESWESFNYWHLSPWQQRPGPFAEPFTHRVRREQCLDSLPCQPLLLSRACCCCHRQWANDCLWECQWRVRHCCSPECHSSRHDSECCSSLSEHKAVKFRDYDA